jgi:hypothetical protein
VIKYLNNFLILFNYKLYKNQMPQYKCDICKKIFELRGDYKRHINRKFSCKEIQSNNDVTNDTQQEDIINIVSLKVTIHNLTKKINDLENKLNKTNEQLNKTNNKLEKINNELNTTKKELKNMKNGNNILNNNILNNNDYSEENKNNEPAKSRKIAQSIRTKILVRQKFKCNNKPHCKLVGLENYECPLWKNGDGTFDESYCDIDHIEEFCLSQNNDISNLQALCKMCHGSKTGNFQYKKEYNKLISN